MQSKNLKTFIFIKYFTLFWALTSTQFSQAKETASGNNTHILPPLTPVIVLDFEMLGDTSVEHLKKTDAYLINKFSKIFRQELKQQAIFDVIDDKKSMDLIAQKSQQQFLHRCNGCELDLAQQIGAKQILVPWIFRMSILIQTLVIEIRDVKTGTLLLKKPYSFRGNTDKAWEKTILYAVKDLKNNMQEYSSIWPVN